MFQSKIPTTTTNEECWILTGHRGRWAWRASYDRYTVGQPASVAFDPEYAWEHRDRIIGWAHTHPHWPAIPSSTDTETMGAMCNCLGRPLLCCIDGTDGFGAWWYLSDEVPPIETRVLRIGKKIYGLKP